MVAYYCLQCSKEVQLMTINHASLVSRVSRKTIYNWIAQGKVHAYETAGGQIRVCLESLIRPYQAKEAAYG
jgi:excisionase family DNA binding protein